MLWDFDGTLVDTEPFWMAAEFRLVEAYGGTWSREDGLMLVGNDLIASGRYIIERTGIPLSPEQVVEALLDDVVAQMRDHIPWRPGARELLDDVRAHDVPCGLVTMSYRRFVEPVMATLAPDTFATVVTGEVVRHGKPHPEPYLQAASRLGVEPASCIAVEDSSTGSASARAAGCATVVVPAHVGVNEARGMTVLSALPRTWTELSEAGRLAGAGYGGPRVNA